MSRRAVEVKVVLLDILTVVALARREPERPLFQDRVLAVPERKAEYEDLIAVANCPHPVLAPTICFAAGHVMAQRVPGGSVLAVVFPHGAPRPFADVGTPAAPEQRVVVRLAEASSLRGVGRDYRFRFN